MRYKNIRALILLPIFIASCSWVNYQKVADVDSLFNYQDLLQVTGLNSIPTPSDDVEILVIPMELTDYPFTAKVLSDIDILFNGTPAQTNYWESVSSFYDKSSYGNLTLSFAIADKYDTGYTAAQAAALDTSETQYFSTNLVRKAVTDYKAHNGGNSSTQQFDDDDDGFIDAVWMIYSAPNYSNSPTIQSISEDYWAYVYWDYNQTPSTYGPTANVYAWASYDFMYEGGGTTRVDGHTYIHETGHLLGLDDYYNYDEDSTYKPTGAIDMMDYNVTDHNAWSKMALGWLKPFVVTGNAEITIDPVESSGDAVLIADDWNGTSFDEFLLLELYTPTGLNQLDSQTSYAGAYPLGFTLPGVRLYHVDSRLGVYDYSNNFIAYEHPASSDLFDPSIQRYYRVANSNTPSNSANEDYRLLHMIQAGGVNTFKFGNPATNLDLFTTGQTFSMATFGWQFFKNGTRLNNGNLLGYKIDFVNVDSSSATIRVSVV
ncbi:MAG: hypothetical protein WC344_01410 [Bacilli bacterium]|jgi:M6 family metalloprotease-like protein